MFHINCGRSYTTMPEYIHYIYMFENKTAVAMYMQFRYVLIMVYIDKNVRKYSPLLIFIIFEHSK